MHIVFFVDFHDSTVGGVQTSVRAQKQALEKLGHVVTTVTPSPLVGVKSDDTNISLPNLPVMRSGGFPMVFPSRRNLRRLEVALKKRPPIDVVHAQTNIGVGILGHQFAAIHQLPLVQTMHGRDDVFAETTFTFPLLQTWLADRLHSHFIKHSAKINASGLSWPARLAWSVMINHAESADWVTVPSAHFKQKFLERGLKNNISVISNGLSDELIAAIPKPSRRSKKDRRLKIMWCGRLSAEKRPLELLRAIKNCQQPVSLTMAGNGPLLAVTKRTIADIGLKSIVSLKSGLDQAAVLRQMAAHDVLVYGSFGFDNQPMVLLEAFAAELPVILCDPDLVECLPRESFLLTASPDPSKISLAIDELAQNPAQLQAMRQRMHRHKKAVFQTTHSKKMLTLYQRFIDEM